MKTVLTSRLQTERGQYALRHTCEDCVYFAVEDNVCSHGYPTATHRLAAFEGVTGHAMFCKEFELV